MKHVVKLGAAETDLGIANIDVGQRYVVPNSEGQN